MNIEFVLDFEDYLERSDGFHRHEVLIDWGNSSIPRINEIIDIGSFICEKDKELLYDAVSYFSWRVSFIEYKKCETIGAIMATIVIDAE